MDCFDYFDIEPHDSSRDIAKAIANLICQRMGGTNGGVAITNPVACANTCSKCPLCNGELEGRLAELLETYRGE
jgi:hypothetical protein